MIHSDYSRKLFRAPKAAAWLVALVLIIAAALGARADELAGHVLPMHCAAAVASTRPAPAPAPGFARVARLTIDGWLRVSDSLAEDR